MKDTGDKMMWGKVDKVGKGTKAAYDPAKKAITFCFSRGEQTSGEQLKQQRERLMKELRELGYASRMKYNGEVLVDNIDEEYVTITKENHKLVIHLKNKLEVDREKAKEQTKEPT